MTKSRPALHFAICAATVACGGGIDGPVAAAPPSRVARLEVVAGDAQRATVGHALPDSVRIRAVDSVGARVGAALISFRVLSGGGHVSSTQGTTDAAGVSGIAWTMGTTAGAASIEASVTSRGLTIATRVVAMANSGATTRIDLHAGGSLFGVPGCTMNRSITVTARDEYGNTVAGVPLFAVNSTPGDMITPATAPTGIDGTASFVWRLGSGGAGARQFQLRADSPTGAPFTDVSGRALAIAPRGLAVVGNQIIDSETCQAVRFVGVNRSTLENGPGWMLSLQDFQVIKSWGANAVRVPLNQDYLLPAALQYKPGYAQTIDQVVNWITSLGMVAILDLHWSDCGNLRAPAPPIGASGVDCLGATQPAPTAQHRMPDPNSLDFWKLIAQRYRGNGRVIFEFYNEPHDVPWTVWRNGGSSGEGYTAVGMQQLYDAVRAAGADNVVIATGLNWGYDLSGLPAYALIGDNIAYATHPYQAVGKEPSRWDADFGNLSATVPVLITETASVSPDCTSQWYQKVIDYADQRRLSWLVWGWYPEAASSNAACTYPVLLLDWNYRLLEKGEYVKARMQAYGGKP